VHLLFLSPGCGEKFIRLAEKKNILPPLSYCSYQPVNWISAGADKLETDAVRGSRENIWRMRQAIISLSETDLDN